MLNEENPEGSENLDAKSWKKIKSRKSWGKTFLTNDILFKYVWEFWKIVA